MTDFELFPRGRYDLAAAIRFLEEWPPTSSGRGGPHRMRWSACLEGSWTPITVSVTQGDGALDCHYVGKADVETVHDHVSRVLSVDTDGTGLDGVRERDPVAGALVEAAPGLRPVCFWTPYEAAVWGVLSQRSSMIQASMLKRRMTEELGIEVSDGVAFPAPETLVEVKAFPGLSEAKLRRLRAVARATLEGRIDSGRLRSLEIGEALEELQVIDGIGPFTAELVLVRGAGHPDVFPRHELRLHGAMRDAYRLPEASVDDLVAIADRWAPYRSWVSFLFRARYRSETA